MRIFSLIFAITFVLSGFGQQRMVKQVNNIAELQLQNPNDIHKTIEVLGYRYPNDGGGGIFSVTNVTTLDGGTRFASTVAGKVWERQVNGVRLNPIMFGGYGDGTNADTTAVQLALNAGSFDFIAGPNGGARTYVLDGTITMLSNREIGAEKNVTLRRHTTSTHTVAFNLAGVSNVVIGGFKKDYNNAPQFYRTFSIQNSWSKDVLVHNIDFYDSVIGMAETYGSGGDRWFFVPNGVATNTTLLRVSGRGPIQIAASAQHIRGYFRIRDFYSEGASANAISLVNAGNAAGGQVIMEGVDIGPGKIIRPFSTGIVFGADTTAGATNVLWINPSVHDVYFELSDATPAKVGFYAKTTDMGMDGLILRNNIFVVAGTANGICARLDNGNNYANSTALITGSSIIGNQFLGGAEGLGIQNTIGLLVANNVFKTNSKSFRTFGPKSDDTKLFNNQFTATAVGGYCIYHDYAGDIEIVGNTFNGWGPAATFNAAIFLNPSSTNDGTSTIWVDGNRFRDTGVAEIAVRRNSVGGVVQALAVRGNDFTGVDTPLSDLATSDPKWWINNIPVTGDNRSLNQVNTTNLVNDSVTGAKINMTEVEPTFEATLDLQEIHWDGPLTNWASTAADRVAVWDSSRRLTNSATMTPAKLELLDPISLNGVDVTDALGANFSDSPYDIQLEHLTGTSPDTVNVKFIRSADLAGNPTLLTGQATFGVAGAIFEGTTADAFEGLLTAATITADRTWTLPDLTGTVALIEHGHDNVAIDGVDISDTLGVNFSSTPYDIDLDHQTGTSPDTVNLNFARAATLGGNPTLLTGYATFGTTGVIFEGTTADANEGLLDATTITGDRTWLLPDGGGSIVITSTRTITSAASPYTVPLDDGTILCDATSGTITVNLPTAASAANRIFNIKKIDSSANSVTIDGSGAETIDDSATKSTTTQYFNWTIQSDGTEWWIL